MGRVRSGLVAGACLWGAAASSAPFDLVLTAPQGPTGSQQALLDDAEAFWEGLVVGRMADAQVGPLTVEVGAYDGDGPGGTLADALPLEVVEAGGFVYSTFGFVDFDVADLEGLEAEGALFEVLIHEIAHVMGFGTLWVDNGVYAHGTGAYTGPAAVAAYRSEFGVEAAFVPVEREAGPGSDDGHWAETWAGGAGALMTSFHDPPTYLSETTLASFRDIGYRTAPPPAPIPAPAGAWLALGALGLLSALRRRA